MYKRLRTSWWKTLMAALFASGTAWAEVKISDITHLQGTRINRLEGWGLVVGLNGTGDGGKHAPTVRALARVHEYFANPVMVQDELKNAKNVAIVYVEAVLSRNGAREGESVDLTVSSTGSAKSLQGGRLLPTPLIGPNPEDDRIWAFGAGPVTLENEDIPTQGRIVRGATLERNWIHGYIVRGRDLLDGQSDVDPYLNSWIQPDEPYITFVINPGHAEFRVAYMIAQAINESETLLETMAGSISAQIARAFDPRTVMVRVPAAERANPAQFVARLEALPVQMPYTEARVSIHRKSGTIIVSGDVQISPTVITHKGLTITTVTPQPPATEDVPRVEVRDWAALDPAGKGGMKLQNLLEALSQLRVPATEKITIIERLHDMGKLHANLVVEQ